MVKNRKIKPSSVVETSSLLLIGGSIAFILVAVGFLIFG